MIRIQEAVLVSLFAFAAVSNGFVPHAPFRQSTVLAARYIPPLPPPPPPGPEPGSIERLIQEATKSFNEWSSHGIQLPRLPDSMASLFNNNNNNNKPVYALDTKIIQEQINALQTQISIFDDKVIQQITTTASQFQLRLMNDYPQLTPWLHKLSLPTLQITSGITLVMASVLTLVFTASLVDYYQKGPSQPYPNGRYDADSARAYFDRRFPIVLQRGFTILLQSLQFGFCVASDIVLYVYETSFSGECMLNIVSHIHIIYSTETRNKRMPLSAAESWRHC